MERPRVIIWLTKERTINAIHASGQVDLLVVEPYDAKARYFKPSQEFMGILGERMVVDRYPPFDDPPYWFDEMWRLAAGDE